MNGVAQMPLFSTDGMNPDLFGDAYEYLMGMYAANAGKKGGQYFTPADVSELLARLGTIGKTKINKVYEMKAPKLIQINYSSAVLPRGYIFGKRVYFASRFNPGCFCFMEVAA